MLGNNHPPCPRNYVCYHSEYDPVRGSHGGCAIYVRYDVAHSVIDLQTSLQAVAVQLHLERKYTICSLYLPPSDAITQDQLRNLRHQLPSPFALIGDMNGRHHSWGDIVTNSRGSTLQSFIEEEDLIALNDGEPTHFHIQTGTFSVIDLALFSSDCFMDFSLKVIDDLCGSDHFPLILGVGASIPAPRSPRWCLNRANWLLFRDLSMIVIDVNEIPTVDEAIQLVNTVFYSAGLQSIPRSSGNFHRRPMPWWNVQCRIAHRSMRAAFTRYRRHKCPHYLISFKKARARFRRQIKTARRESWKLFISSITWKTPISQVWNKIRKIAGKYIPKPPPVLQINGLKVADSKQVGNAFANHFANVSRKNEDAPYYRYRIQEEQIHLNFKTNKSKTYNLPFTMKEFLSALKTCNDTAPGPDEIPYVMIKNTSPETKAFLLDLLNRIFGESCFPKIWEKFFMLPFSKPGKDSKNVSSYRPIALTSCLCKIMEKMVNCRLVWYLEQNNYLSTSQCGFRRMRSCTDVLIRLEASICRAFVTKQHHITVFFDIEKAYDTTWRYGALKMLHECELRGELPLFIKAFLQHRTFQVKIGNTLSDSKVQEEGVPQGSVLSVTLFALALNGISKVIPDEVMHTLFVDDLSLSFAASKMSAAERKLQITINRVIKWGEQHGFKFSFSKSVVMHFCRLRGVHPDPDLYIHDQRISCVEQTRFLGLIFDNRLSWVPHLKDLKNRCMKALDILRVLSHVSWGADRNQLLHLYKSLVLSKLAYGCEIYSSATKARLSILDPVHHAGIRLATGAFRSSPIPSLLVDAGELPLDLHRQSLIIRYWYRVQRLPDSLTFKEILSVRNFNLFDKYSRSPKPFSYRAKKILDDFSLPKSQILSFKYSFIPPWKLACVDFCKPCLSSKKDSSDSMRRLEFLEHADTHTDSVCIYTDGSKSDAGVGFGVIFPDFTRSGALPFNFSNFTAELFGILVAVKEILSLERGDFIVFTDSKGVLEALECFNSSHPFVVDILEWVYLAKRRGRTISFCRVPAHVGVWGNEEADRLAKDAALNLRPANIALPFRDLFPAVRESFKSAWQFYWDIEINNKMREITGKTKPWFYTHNTRKQEVSLCRLRIGHTRMTHGFLMSGDPPPYCEDCLVVFTVKHLLTECPSFLDLRERLLFYGKEDGIFVLSKLLGPDCQEENLFKFIKEAGFLDNI